MRSVRGLAVAAEYRAQRREVLFDDSALVGSDEWSVAFYGSAARAGGALPRTARGGG